MAVEADAMLLRPQVVPAPSETMTFAAVISRLIAVQSPMLIRYLKTNDLSHLFFEKMMSTLPSQLPSVPFSAVVTVDPYDVSDPPSLFIAASWKD